MCEELFAFSILENNNLSAQDLATYLQKCPPIHDKSQDMHYNMKSALFKSIIKCPSSHQVISSVIA
jgi:replication-associated recombination protein RarA